MSNPLPPNFKLVLTFLLPLAAQAQTNCDLPGRPFTLPHLEAAIATGQLSLLILAQDISDGHVYPVHSVVLSNRM